MAGRDAIVLDFKLKRNTGTTPLSVSSVEPGPESSVSSLVVLDGISKQFGSLLAVHPLSLEIRRGDFLAILGPSGCGKTTLLRMIAGFIEPDHGTIRMEGRDVTRLGPDKRPSNMVFQGYGLFPHMTVKQNVAYGLRVARRPEAEISERVAETLALVHLEALAERSVMQLSGGQAQRVALARALVMKPAVLLLDEPLAALDLKLRRMVQEELRRIHASIGGTFVFVTHDQEEAMALANRIVVMEAGSIIQEGTSEQIYDRPQSRFVSTFIGEANLFSGECRNGLISSDIGPTFAAEATDGPVAIVVRPQVMKLHPAGPQHLSDPQPDGEADFRMHGRLGDAVFLGTYVKYSVTLDNDAIVTVLAPDRTLRRDLAVGDDVVVTWSAADQRIVSDRG